MLVESSAVSVAISTGASVKVVPTLSTDGMSLGDAFGWRVIVSALVGQTLSGGGNLRCYLWSYTQLRWIPAPALDIAVTATGRDQTSEDFEVTVPSGRLYYTADAVTVSGGATLVVTLEMSRR